MYYNTEYKYFKCVIVLYEITCRYVLINWQKLCQIIGNRNVKTKGKTNVPFKTTEKVKYPNSPWLILASLTMPN